MDSTTEDLRCMDEYLEDEAELPGFRFHPTDDELVSFYLRRKLDNKPISIELIKQIDIYKYDPWDLPKAGSTGGEKEGYFYCKRGRKYRNSIRPNRVTGSGFWKATGIDKPVFSHGGEGNDCIGLKKTLVYYRGCAGKGTKTEWMMHEFRLPPNNTTKDDTTNIAQEAEIWTLCRIFKRHASQRKCTPDWRHLGGKRHSTEKSSIRSMSSSTVTVESCNRTAVADNREAYINFGGTFQEQKPVINNHTSNYYSNDNHRNYNQVCVSQSSPSSVPLSHQLAAPSSSALSFWINQASNDLFAFENSWDELGSVVQFPL